MGPFLGSAAAYGCGSGVAESLYLRFDSLFAATGVTADAAPSSSDLIDHGLAPLDSNSDGAASEPGVPGAPKGPGATLPSPLLSSSALDLFSSSFLFRLKKSRAKTAKTAMAPTETPTPIPAFAPTLKPPPPLLLSPRSPPSVCEGAASPDVALVEGPLESVVGEGTCPGCHMTLWPEAVGSCTTFSRMDASVKATVREVEGQKQWSAEVRVSGREDCEQATHWLEVPLQ
jgi:hypothetical protein